MILRRSFWGIYGNLCFVGFARLVILVPILRQVSPPKIDYPLCFLVFISAGDSSGAFRGVGFWGLKKPDCS